MTSQRLLPALPADRIRTVGQALFGDRWRFKLARSMEVGRTTLFEWLRGGETPADMDELLGRAIRREREARDEIDVRLVAMAIELASGVPI